MPKLRWRELRCRKEWQIIAVGLLILVVIAVYGLIWMFRPALESKVSLREALVNAAPGCPAEQNPHPSLNHTDYALFALIDRRGDTRGYLFGLTEGRWGRVSRLPDWFQGALSRSTVLVTHQRSGEQNWYDGYAPNHRFSLGKLVDKRDQTGLGQLFKTCRLGGFWRDMHAAFAGDLIEFCTASHAEDADEQASLVTSCGLKDSLKRHALNQPVDRLNLQDADDRKRIFDTAERSDLLELFRHLAAPEGSPLLTSGAFSLVEAELAEQQLAQQSQSLHQLLQVEPNRVWLDNMLQFMAGEVPFFMIDIRNLAGRDGLLTLLANKGFKAKALGD